MHKQTSNTKTLFYGYYYVGLGRTLCQSRYHQPLFILYLHVYEISCFLCLMLSKKYVMLSSAVTYTNMLHATFFEIKGKKRQKSVKSGFLVALFFMWHSGVSIEGPCVTSRWSRTLSFHHAFPTPRLGCIYFVMGKLAETYLQKKEEWWDETIPLSTFHFKVSK